MPRSLSRSSSRSVSGVAARSAGPVVAVEREVPAPGLDHTADPTLAPWPCRNVRPRALASEHAATTRRRRWLVDLVVAHALPAGRRRASRCRVLDPACGDGRFLVAAADRLRAAGGRADAPRHRHRRRRAAAAGAASLGGRRGDVARRASATPSPATGAATASTSSSATRRSCRSWPRRRRAAGPAATAAGRTPTPPPSSSPSPSARPARRRARRARAAAVDPRLARRRPVRAEVDRLADRSLVVVVAAAACSTPRCSCARWPSSARRGAADGRRRAVDPSSSPTRSASPPLPPLATAGTLGDRARLTANFRDEYYGLVPAVGDDGAGPPLVTSGLIDPGRCRWGGATVTFARRRSSARRRPRPAQPADAALGRRAARAQGAGRQPDPGHRGRRRPRRRLAARASR